MKNLTPDRCAMLLATLFFSLNATALDCPSDLFISEYIEGSSNNKCIEIYNGTGAAVDLAAEGYSLVFFFNGNTTPGTSIDLVGTVADGDVWVVCDNNADPGFMADQTSTSNFYNGDDAVVLRHAGEDIDIFGRIGEDPGSQWSVSGNTTQNNTLRRNSNITSGNTANAAGFPSLGTEWTEFPQNNNADLGSHTVDDCDFPPDPPFDPNRLVACPTEVFISEYIEGSGFNKCIEVYNGTGSIIDLDADVYKLTFYFNGNTSAGTEIELSGCIAPGDVHVVCDDGAASAFTDEADQLPTNNFFNGDDAVALTRGPSTPSGPIFLLDIVGTIGEDPGSQWGDFSRGTKEQTLRRKSNVTSGSIDNDPGFPTLNEWERYPQNNSDDLGSHTADLCVIACTPPKSDSDSGSGSGSGSGSSSTTSSTDDKTFVLMCQPASTTSSSGSHSGSGSGSGSDSSDDDDDNGKGPQTRCVNINKVGKLLAKGWTLGPCPEACPTAVKRGLAGSDAMEATSSDNWLTAYPNPFNVSTRISFSMQDDSHAVLEVFNVNGSLITQLYNGNIEANQVYNFDFAGDDLAKGLYITKLTTPSGILYQKLMIIK